MATSWVKDFSTLHITWLLKPAGIHAATKDVVRLMPPLFWEIKSGGFFRHERKKGVRFKLTSHTRFWEFCTVKTGY